MEQGQVKGESRGQDVGVVLRRDCPTKKISAET